ncbi:MAG: nucleoside-diphosphate kinase [Thaumarchaeota archaeon]|nr:nucleoside-diphosphate kinase [Nitrososphaerota archaeon]
MDQTLVVLKPDAVQRGLIGEIVGRFEKRGFRIRKMRMLTFGHEIAADFYSPHAGKPFFSDLERFITSGPVVGIVLEGNNAVEVVRNMIGKTKSDEAISGTIRGDYALGYTDNIIHASDSVDSYIRESKIVFPENR